MSEICPKCGSTNTNPHGRFIHCNDCKKYTSRAEKEAGSESIEYTRDWINIICSSRRILGEADIIERFKIDPTRWELESIIVKTSEGYRKDRSVEWVVEEGKVRHGVVNDSGKMLVVPMYHISARFTKKAAEIKDRAALESFITYAKTFTPKYKKIKYQKQKNGALLEIGLPDIQLGRLVMADEAGKDLSPEIAIKQADGVIDSLLTYSKGFVIERVLFPIGNDFFDANTAAGATAHGTLQRDDVRWQRTFDMGARFMVRTIDKLLQIAPVDVLVVPGNHDEERIFYLGEYLAAWYRAAKDATIDNRPIKRKYYHYKNNLIGFTHGYYEKNDKLSALMPQEVPELWAKANNREWHLGDKHHKVDMIYKTNEYENGVTVRILRSIASPSVWEFDKGFTGSLQAGEAFIWHPEDGVIAQFTGRVKQQGKLRV